MPSSTPREGSADPLLLQRPPTKSAQLARKTRMVIGAQRRTTAHNGGEK